MEEKTKSKNCFKSKYQNIGVAKDVHEQAVAHTQKTFTLLGKWVERAILEKIERESQPLKNSLSA